jgi:hypothetical protein
MITSEDARTLAADLSRMTTRPVPVERAEETLADDMAWLPQGEPLQCIAEDCTWDIAAPAGAHKLHRRTILTRQAEDRLSIAVEVALMRPDGIELERRQFDAPSGEADGYLQTLRDRLASEA